MAKTKTTKKKTAAKTASKASSKTTTKATKATTKKSPVKKTTKKKKADPEVKVDRRVRDERRESETEDRRQQAIDVNEERREVGTERRAKVNRRRQIDPTTCERDYNGEEIEFMQALDAYKRAAGRMFPTCSEILEVIRDLGYRRLTPEEQMKLGPPAAAEADGEVTEEDTADEGALAATSADEAGMEDALDQLEG